MKLFDVQVNGFAGVDFQQLSITLEQMRIAVDALGQCNTPLFFPALITDKIDSLRKKFERLEKLRSADPVIASAVPGYHLEGPWLSPEKGFCGAHRSELMSKPCLEDFKRLQESANGMIRLTTIAPEWPDSDSFIAEIVQQGVEVSIGHSNASETDIDRAIEAGARFVTHLGNGVPRALDRHDNILQRLLCRDELYAFFIPDGIHLPPSVLQNFVRAKPEGKALFTTDCMAAAYAKAGRYTLANLELEVGNDRIVRMPGETNFAGSALTPDTGVANLHRWLQWPQEKCEAKFGSDVAALFNLSLD